VKPGQQRRENWTGKIGPEQFLILQGRAGECRKTRLPGVTLPTCASAI